MIKIGNRLDNRKNTRKRTINRNPLRNADNLIEKYKMTRIFEKKNLRTDTIF